jgi:hypothetical protein
VARRARIGAGAGGAPWRGWPAARARRGMRQRIWARRQPPLALAAEEESDGDRNEERGGSQKKKTRSVATGNLRCSVESLSC